MGRTDPASREFWQPRGARGGLGGLSDGIWSSCSGMCVRDRAALELLDVLCRCDAAVCDPVVVPLLYSFPSMAHCPIFGRRERTRLHAVGEYGCSVAPAGRGGHAAEEQQDHRMCSRNQPLAINAVFVYERGVVPACESASLQLRRHSRAFVHTLP